MDEFLKQHSSKIKDVISCFDRMIIKGYLPFWTPKQVEYFLFEKGILLKDFREYTKNLTEQLRIYSEGIAAQHNRPIDFLFTKVRKEDHVRKIIERDNIKEGLVCILRINEEGKSYGYRYAKGNSYLKVVKPQCMTIYYYFIDRELGLMHIRLQTWLPFTIQFYVNGHEWLARQLDKKGIKYKKEDNVFTDIADVEKAQEISDKFCKIGWLKKLKAMATRANPFLKTILKGMEYYWVLDQIEYSTDVIFTDRPAMESLYINMQKHSSVCIQAEDLLRILGKTNDRRFRGEVITRYCKRTEFTRVRHEVNGNWIKMYDKSGIVLRVETVINKPKLFKVRKKCMRKGKSVMAWNPMSKSIVNLHRYQAISLSANRKYLGMMNGIIDPQSTIKKLKKLTEPVIKGEYRYRGFNPLKQSDVKLFEALNRGEYSINGFKSSEVAKHMGLEYSPDEAERKRQCAKVNRIMRLFHYHGIVAKIQNTRRYRLTSYGTEMLSSALYLYREKYPEMLNKAA